MYGIFSPDLESTVPYSRTVLDLVHVQCIAIGYSIGSYCTAVQYGLTVHVRTVHVGIPTYNSYILVVRMVSIAVYTKRRSHVHTIVDLVPGTVLHMATVSLYYTYRYQYGTVQLYMYVVY